MPGKRRRARPERRWLDNIRNDLSEKTVRKEAQDRVKWRRLIRNIDPTNSGKRCGRGRRMIGINSFPDLELTRVILCYRVINYETKSCFILLVCGPCLEVFKMHFTRRADRVLATTPG